MEKKPNPNEELHKNHRQRMKERILTQGLSSLQEHEVLEYLLYYAVQRRDTNPLAHRLIRHCGSLNGVLTASYDDLLSVSGVTPHIAMFLSTLSQVFAYGKAKAAKEQKPTLGTPQERRAFAKTCLVGGALERACIVALDAEKRLIAVRDDFSGSMDQLILDVREIIAFCLNKRAVYLMLAHTHPTGVTNPSTGDINATQKIARTLDNIGVILLDHIVVAGDHTYSFAENFLL
jgi:DNA repair protein RadC